MTDTMTRTPEQGTTEGTESDTAAPFTVTIEGTKENLAGIAATAVFAGARDKATPILDTVRFTATHAIATDRYVAGRFEHTVTESAESAAVPSTEGITVPREIAEWIGKIKPSASAPRTVGAVISITAERAEYTEFGRVIESRSFAPITGNFPPVERLIFDHSDELQETMPFALSPKNLGKVVKAGALISASLGKQETAIRFQHSQSANSAKPGPLRASIGRLVMLIQPSLIR